MWHANGQFAILQIYPSPVIGPEKKLSPQVPLQNWGGGIDSLDHRSQPEATLLTAWLRRYAVKSYNLIDMITGRAFL